MSIKFDLSTSQSIIFFTDVKIKAGENLIDFSKKHTNIARFIGLPIAICSSLLELSIVVSTVGEIVLKGIINIFGSPFSKKCNLSRGVKQIFLKLPLYIIINAIGFPLATVSEILVTPIKILISPTATLESRTKKTKELRDQASNDQAEKFFFKHIYA